MSFWFWVNVGAWSTVIVLSLALVLIIVSAGLRRASDVYFVLFNLMRAFGAVGAILSALTLWLGRGNSQLMVEFNTLGASFSCIFLLMFAMHYFEFISRTLRMMRVVSITALGTHTLLLWPLFRHQVIYDPVLSATGIPLTQFTLLGLIASAIPLGCMVGAGTLFWQRKEAPGSRPLTLSVLILTLGFLLGGLFNWPFPVFALTTAGGMGVMGYTVMNRQLFNPLQKLTAELELRVAERTAALEKAYADLAMQSEQSIIAHAEAERARQSAEAANQALQAQIWLANGQAQLSQQLRVAQDVPTLAYNVIHQLCHYLDAPVGALYVMQEQRLTLAGAYAYQPPADGPWQFALGEGVIGQAAQNQAVMVLHDLPDHYLTVLSGVGQIRPRQLVIAPFLYNRQVIGVIELGTLDEFSPAHLEFLNLALEAIAMTCYTLQAREKLTRGYTLDYP